MKGAVVAVALALALCVTPGPGALAQSRAGGDPSAAQHRVPVERIVSPRGLEAWLVSDSTVPMIVLRAYWRGGSASEPAALTGVTAIMADMMTEGSGELDANAFKERLQDLNMALSFGASWDGVGMSLTTLSENRGAAFELARLALQRPRFDAAPLERIKRQQLVGIRTRETNPSFIANLALDQALYPDHPYARRTSRDHIAAIDRAALSARRAALFNRATLQITIVGDIDAEAAGHAIDAIFADLPQGTAPPAPVTTSFRSPTPLIVRPLPQPQSLVLFAGPGIQDEDPDWIALTVANYIFGGGGFSSRLMQEVREQRGLVYGIGTSPSVRDQIAMIRGSAQSENGDVGEAVALTRAEMDRLFREGATQAEVNDAITYLTGSFALDIDSNTKIAAVLHSHQIAGRDIDYVNRRNDLIRAVTLADVNRVIRRLFDPEAFTFVVVGQPEGLGAAATP
ncbi:MAG: insulinase family protein [Hyphomonadaceae bacterium]|nr:insulinase family protein [Hyphomonadaceae bacterium]